MPLQSHQRTNSPSCYNPAISRLPIQRWVHPDTFETYRAEGLNRGFKVVESGPLVRSSYHADVQADVPTTIERQRQRFEA